jgi:hypothetical protein
MVVAVFTFFLAALTGSLCETKELELRVEPKSGGAWDDTSLVQLSARPHAAPPQDTTNPTVCVVQDNVCKDITIDDMRSGDGMYAYGYGVAASNARVSEASRMESRRHFPTYRRHGGEPVF